MAHPNVDCLLSALTEQDSQLYHEQLVSKVTGRDENVFINLDSGEGKGKGAFAAKHIPEGIEIFRELPLVGEQHTENRKHALVCDHTFCYVGSIELQLGYRLLVNGLGNSSDAKELLQGTRRLPKADLGTPDAAYQFPTAVRCPGGCDLLFSSHDCAAAAWCQWHCLLCTQTASDVHIQMNSSSDVVPFDIGACSAEWQQLISGAADAHGDGAGGSQGACAPRPPFLPRLPQPAALSAFFEHADSSNDIFRVAARVVARVTCQALRSCTLSVGSATPGTRSPAAVAADTAEQSCESEDRAAAIMAAWRPFQAAHKAVWWECVPMPEDLTSEEEWQSDLRQMAVDSLDLLRAALRDLVPEVLLHERVWGSIIGMFELNNLSLVVQSPVENYFLAVDDLPEPQRTEAMAETQPLLDLLDKDYDICCESCLNHADKPNAHAIKGDEETDGSAVISAVTDIAAGEEICISYVDEDAPQDERLQILRDYGIHS